MEQNIDSDRFTPQPVMVIILLGVALGIPWLVIATSSVAAGRGWLCLPAPFGVHQVLCVHLLAVLPIGWLAARSINVSSAPKRIEWVGFASAFTTLSLTFYICLYSDTWLPGLDVTTSWLLRSLWSLVLVLPWCLLASCFQLPLAAHQPTAIRAVNLLTVLGVALVLPRLFTLDVVRKQTRTAEELLGYGRIVSTERVVQRIAAIGSDLPILGVSVPVTFDQLKVKIAALEQELKTPLSADANVAERFNYANLLYAADQLENARDLLVPFANERPDAALMLAGIWNDLSDLDQSIVSCRTCLELLAPQGETDPLINELREQAYARLAVFLRKNDQFKEAESLLRSGLNQWRVSRGFLNLQLAQHYQHGGRPFEAIRHYRLAAEEDPIYSEVARDAVTILRQNTPACILRPSSSPAF